MNSTSTPSKLLTLLLLFAVASLTAHCQTRTRSVGEMGQIAPSLLLESQTNGFKERSFVNARNERLGYLLFVPKDYDQRKKYPLVLWLHGGGSRGNDLKVLLSYGDDHGPGYFARADNQAKYPSFVVAPQCPQNGLWGDPDSERPTKPMSLVLEILDQLQLDYSIDNHRLYVSGISLGGYGTWDIIARRPEMFAAAVPICGGGNIAGAPAMRKTAIWAFHGDRDELVNVTESRKMIAAIRSAGGKPNYTEYKGVGHNSWERAFAEPELLPWMFAQRR